MKLESLSTPAVLVDLDRLERNLRRYQELCDRHGKELWPMTKTHKSTHIALMQQRLGATGFLCGTLDECELLAEAGIGTIMYAYPLSTGENLRRAIALSRRVRFVTRVDCPENIALLGSAAREANTVILCTVIVDSGLHRFGVPPQRVVAMARQVERWESLLFQGISTHPGHVYSAKTPQELPSYVQQEKQSMSRAKQALVEAGFAVELVTSGSTPTFASAVDDQTIQIYHPGNYVFHDYIQMANGTAAEEDCALTVLASVISRPRDGLLIVDAGAKCLGLDQGAHGNDAIQGFGYVPGHPELTVKSLSEEVGKITVQGDTSVKVGDRICIIPNHSCVPANLTGYLYGHRGDVVEQAIPVDMRGNSRNLLNT